jgi:hypothetical protein
MGRHRSSQDVAGREPPEDPAGTAFLARPEFDGAAKAALAMPGISNETRERIKDWARKLVREGMSREDVEFRICREVIVALASQEYRAPDTDDPAFFALAQAVINSKAGGKRQAAGETKRRHQALGSAMPSGHGKGRFQQGQEAKRIGP